MKNKKKSRYNFAEFATNVLAIFYVFFYNKTNNPKITKQFTIKFFFPLCLTTTKNDARIYAKSNEYAYDPIREREKNLIQQ